MFYTKDIYVMILLKKWDPWLETQYAGTVNLRFHLDSLAVACSEFELVVGASQK